MSWRTVLITQRCKLDLSMNYLEVRGEETKRIHLSEIHTLILESTAISLTAALLCELMHRKIKVIFCDEKRNPQSELIPYYGNHDTSACVKQQIGWKPETKRLVWTEIVTEKIRKQQEILVEKGKTDRAAMLERYIHDSLQEDIINKEGHAAKVYFSGLFGPDFTRSQENVINASLNYGYSILLSTFNKEIVSSGYLTQIGLFHDNMFNPYNLASDLMEPFRPLIDRVVLSVNPHELDKDTKCSLVNALNMKVVIDGQEQYVSNAIKIYTRSVLESMNENNTGDLRFYQLIPAKQNEKDSHVEGCYTALKTEMETKIESLLNAQ